MSVRHRTTRSGRTRLRAVVPVLIVMSLASLGGAQLVSAEPPPTARTMTADEARASGSAIGVRRHAERSGEILELQMPAAIVGTSVLPLPASERARRDAARFLDTASNGAVAVAEGIGDPHAGIMVTAPDGSQADTALSGVAGAAFSVDGSWLAAVDAAGRLWHIEARTGSATRLAAGPYTGSVHFTRSGDLLLVEAASSDSIFPSVVIRFSPATRKATVLDTEDGFVFSAVELADSSVAVTAHVFGGGVAVRRVTEGSAELLASLDPNAIDPSLSADGGRIGYSVGGAVYLHDVAGGSTRGLGRGEMPRIAADGGSLLVRRDGRTTLLAPDGGELDRFATAAVGWASCGEECRP
jgi:hypothetical protein